MTFAAVEPLDLPAYLGSTLRGAFGRAFRQRCCPARPDEPCPVPAACPYHLVFETAPPADAEVAFDLTLIGCGRDFLAHVVVAFREVDRSGRGRRAVALSRIDALQPLTGAETTVYAATDGLVPRGRCARAGAAQADLAP